MEYSVTNMFAQKMTENVYVKAFAQGEEMEQRELPPVVSVLKVRGSCGAFGFVAEGRRL